MDADVLLKSRRPGDCSAAVSAANDARCTDCTGCTVALPNYAVLNQARRLRRRGPGVSAAAQPWEARAAHARPHTSSAVVRRLFRHQVRRSGPRRTVFPVGRLSGSWAPRTAVQHRRRLAAIRRSLPPAPLYSARLTLNRHDLTARADARTHRVLRGVGGVARWQVPENWSFVPEIPKMAVGKFGKKVLRASRAAGELNVGRL